MEIILHVIGLCPDSYQHIDLLELLSSVQHLQFTIYNFFHKFGNMLLTLLRQWFSKF